MSCQEVQAQLSLYLYGELDFAREEQIEQHLSECAFCQASLARDKSWHTALNAEQRDVPLDLLAGCRQELRASLLGERVAAHGLADSTSLLDRLKPLFDFRGWFDLRFTKWSAQVAMASLLVAMGFGAGTWIQRNGTGLGGGPSSAMAMGVFDPKQMRVRNVEPGADDRVRITVEEVRAGEITGVASDSQVREILMTAARRSVDPGVRVDSVEMLMGQSGSDIRDALVDSARGDPNAAVRMKALEGLRRFRNDAETRAALRFVLAHDNDAGVRSEAIDVLAPSDERLTVTPELLQTLEDVMRAGEPDDYVHSRCVRILQQSKGVQSVY